MESKFCYYCKKNKPISEFDEIVMNGKECLRGWCKGCSAEYEAKRQKILARMMTV